MPVDNKHPDYEKALPRWKLVDDMCEEDNLAEHIYNLDVHDDNKKNNEFKARASFLGVCGFTEAGLTGIAFDDDPQLELPSTLEYLEKDVDGSGLDFTQQINDTTSQVLRKGRAGLFVTYPAREGDTSVAEQRQGNAVATVHLIKADRIVNWWAVKVGAKTVLGGVVFTDTMETREGFDVEVEDIWRSLTLEEGRLVDAKWRKTQQGVFEVIESSQPVDGSGSPWTEIPFTFIGAMDNTTTVDRAPLYSLAKKNADHLNNSAINEEGIWFSGHIQPVADDMDPAAYDTMLASNDGKGFKIGAGQMLIAKGFRFEVAQPNSAARQGMLDKIEDMKAIGARILQPGGVAKTAQQDAGEQKVQHSVLSLVIVNIEDAYNVALRWAAQYMNAPEAMLELSRNFMLPAVNPEMIDRLIALYDRSLVGSNEAHRVLTRAKIVDDEKTVEEYAEEVDARGGLVSGLEDAGDGF